MSHIKATVIILCLFLFNEIKSYSQYVAASAGCYSSITTKQSIYSTLGGLGAGFNGRVAFTKWLYLQGGFSIYHVFTQEEAIKSYGLSSWNSHLGFVPMQKIPIHFSFGTFQHKYKIVTKAEVNYGYVFLPSYTNIRKMDGWHAGIGYPLKSWLELHLRYEMEPFRMFKHPITTSFIGIEVIAIAKQKIGKSQK